MQKIFLQIGGNCSRNFYRKYRKNIVKVSIKWKLLVLFRAQNKFMNRFTFVSRYYEKSLIVNTFPEYKLTKVNIRLRTIFSVLCCYEIDWDKKATFQVRDIYENSPMFNIVFGAGAIGSRAVRAA
jgi:hypothetical protein